MPDDLPASRGRAARIGGIVAVAAAAGLGVALAAQAPSERNPATDLAAATSTPRPAPAPTTAPRATSSPASAPGPTRSPTSGPEETGSPAATPEPTRSPLPPFSLAGSPAPAPEPSRSPAPSPQPTEREPSTEASEREPSDSPLFGLTIDGELIRLDPATGETLEVLAQDPAFGGSPLTVSPDGETAYVETGGEPYGTWPTITRVSLADGATHALGLGLAPALSPDGGTLAFVAPPDDTATEVVDDSGLALLDVASGERRYVEDGTQSLMFAVSGPAWSADGARVLVPTGWANEFGPGSGNLSIVDVAALPPNLLDAPKLEPEGETVVDGLYRSRIYVDGWGLPDGRVAALEYQSTTPEGSGPMAATWQTTRYLVLVADGAVERRTPLPVQAREGVTERVTVTSLVPRAGATGLLLVIGRENYRTGESEASLWAWDGQQAWSELRAGIAAVDL